MPNDSLLFPQISQHHIATELQSYLVDNDLLHVVQEDNISLPIVQDSSTSTPIPSAQSSPTHMSVTEPIQSQQKISIHNNTSQASTLVFSLFVNSTTRVTEIALVQTPSTNSFSPLIQNSTIHSIQQFNTHPTLTRAKIGNFKPKVFLSHIEPTFVKQALAHPDWFKAMLLEYDTFLDNKSWTLTSLPPHRKTVGCKGIFKVKENRYGTINKFKARLVAKTYHQQYGFY